MITLDDINHQRHIGTEELKLLAAFIVGYKFDLGGIIEIGVATGGATKLWQRLLSEDGLYIGIDINLNDPSQGLYGEFEETKKKFADDSRLCFLTADSRNIETIELVKNILKGDKIDLLYIDGEHSYEGALKDYELYSPFVESDGLIVWHDATRNSNVLKAIQQVVDPFKDVPLAGSATPAYYGAGKYCIRFDSKAGHCGILAIVKE